ncbi:hypothetical protein F5Y08DRAFT_167164 [Xylaria arbuscula]|nr:hypothetical protein F5Y08DRAFT_167164 [Xylaria arbuscula]
MRAAYLLLLGDIQITVMASFQTNFSRITQHTDLLLEWEAVKATDYPLALHLSVFNVTDDQRVNTFEADIATELTGNSFLWNDLPSPLPFLPSATYELHLLRQVSLENPEPGAVITSSAPFNISSEIEGGDDDRGWQTATSEPASTPSKPANPNASEHSNNSTAIAAGLVVPFVVGISIFVLTRMQRRRKKILAERRKERQTLVID